MRSAPSARYPVGRSRFLAVLMLAVWGLGVAGIVGWCFLGPAPGWRHLSTALLLLACGAYAIWYWRRMPQGELAWDGEAWWWHGDAQVDQPARIEHRVDLQSVLLLQMRLTAIDAAGTRGLLWLVLSRDADGASWQALRRAVYFWTGRQAKSEAVPAHP